MEMNLLKFLFIFLFVINVIKSKGLLYYTNFKFEKIVFGAENLMKDYVTLANDPKADLPDSYTVCNSVFVKFPTTASSVIEMLKNDGSHWYLLELKHTDRIYEKFSENVEISLENPSTGKHEREFFSKSVIPIVPHSWFHICMGLDTVSGLLRIVVNGIEVVNEEKEYFKNTTHWKPKSLKGAILQFMGYAGGFWYQHRSMFSYMNIFKSMMSTDDMVKRTSGGEECYIQGDYLRCCYSYCTPFVANNFILSAGMRWNGM